jgi:hypothetical protein
MWGRLDAAARIIDLLVAPGRAKQLREDDPTSSAAETLADGLLACEPEEDQRWLLEEALAEAGAPAPPEPPDGSAPPQTLRARLVAALEADLAGNGGLKGDLTRKICARAAQLEILAHELPHLNEESKNDAKLGAGAPALDLPLTPNGPLRPAIEELRSGDSPRKRLTADDEVASALAMRTSTQATLVTLGVLRAARMPLAHALFGVRAGLLPVAGSVARHPLIRFGAWVAFYAAALFIAGRLLTTETRGFEDLHTITLIAELVALFMVLVVAGTAFVPFFRARFAKKRSRKVIQYLWAAGILASGGLAALLLTWIAGGVSIDRLITAPHAQRPPDWVLGTVVAFMVGGPLVAAPALVRGRLNSIMEKPWGGKASLGLVGAIAGLVIGYSIGDVAHYLHGNWWQLVIAILALFVAPIVAFVSLFWRSAR